MQEIEVKARVANPEALRAALAALNIRLNDPAVQDDTIYTEGNFDFTIFQKDKNFIRIRRQTGRAVLTLKRPGKNELHMTEHETAVANPEETHEILLLIGYKPIVEVKKSRQKAKYNDLEICLDEVEGLGTYIEVEKLLEASNDPEKVQEELYVFLESLGVKREDREMHGYDTLVYLKNAEK